MGRSDGSVSWVLAAWSPHGRYLVVANPASFAGDRPKGAVRWSPRARRSPGRCWEGVTSLYTRIDYLASSGLLIVAGYGTNDRCSTPTPLPIHLPGTEPLRARRSPTRRAAPSFCSRSTAFARSVRTRCPHTSTVLSERRPAALGCRARRCHRASTAPAFVRTIVTLKLAARRSVPARRHLLAVTSATTGLRPSTM